MDREQIISVSGPKEGIGKTSFAINFAAQYAFNTKKQVIVIDCDKNCREDVLYYLNVSSAQTVEELWELVQKVDIDAIDPNLFKGRISFNEQGVGILNLAADEKTAALLSPAHILKVIAIFSRLYTCIIDAESLASDYRLPIYDMSDYVFWLMTPTVVDLKNTVFYFEYLRKENFSMNKFGIILNKSDIFDAISLRQINSKLSTFNKNIMEAIPFEKVVSQAIAARQLIIVDKPHTQFAKSIRELVAGIINITEKTKAGVGKGTLWHDLIEHISDKDDIKSKKEKKDRNKEKENEREAIKVKVHKEVIEELNNKRIDLSLADDDPKQKERLRQIVTDTAAKILSSYGDMGFSRQESQAIVSDVLDDALGLGPLEKLLRDKDITEIMVNKKDQIYIEHKGKLRVADEKFSTDEQVVQVIRRIIAPLGRRIDESVPLVDARLTDGSRVNAIIPPLVVQGPMITIRRFPEKVFDENDFLGFRSLNKDMVDFLKACVISRKNIIVSGGTGSGKTTLLNMLSSFIPPGERIITIEDVAELKLQQEHLGRLESRPPNIEGKGEITIRELVKNTLRMRPDRIVVGECRGGEALDMLQAMNTGHDGSLTTIHANTPHDMISRLEAMVLMSGAELPIRVIRGYIASAVNFVVQIARMQDGSRKVVAATEVLGIDETTMAIKMQDIFVFKRTGLDKEGKVLGQFKPTGIVPACYDDFALRGVKLSSAIFKKKGKKEGV